MKTTSLVIVALFLSFLFTGCDKEEGNLPEPASENQSLEGGISNIPDGYFEVMFSPKQSPDTRTAVSGSDLRVRSIRYVIYKSTGEFIKEKVVLKPTDSAPVWPLTAIRDTLPQGQYTAVFLANMDKTQFPISGTGGSTYSDILTNYQTIRANARINLPGSEFSDTSEFYFANVSFSNTSPYPSVLLQRIITMLNLRRVFVDSQTALNSLTNNIVTQIGYKNMIKTTVQGLLRAY